MAPSGKLDTRQVARGVAVAYIALAAVALLVQVGPFVPLGVVIFGWLLVRTIANPRFGLMASLVGSLTIPVQLSLRVGPFALSPGRLLGFAFIIGWVASLSRRDGPTLRRTALDVGIGGLLVAFGLSIVANSAGMTQIGFAEAIRKLLVFGIDYFAYFYAAVSVMAAGRRHLDRVLRVAVATAVGVAAVGVLEQVTGRNIFTFLEPVLPLNVAAYVRVLAENSVLARGSIVRVRSTFEGPHAFGAVLTVSAPLLLHYWSVSRHHRRGIYLLGASIVSLAAMATATRGVYLSFSLSLIAYAVASGRVRANRRHLAALVLVLVIAAGSNADLRATMSLYFRGLSTLQERSIQGRVADYANVAQQLDRAPFAGSGPATWDVRATKRGENPLVEPTDPEAVVLDNYFLVILAELGLFGLLAFMVVIAGGLLLAWRAVLRARDPADRSLAAALFAGMAGFAVLVFVFDMFAFAGPVRLYFVVLAAAAVLSGAERRVARPVLSPEKRGTQ